MSDREEEQQPQPDPYQPFSMEGGSALTEPSQPRGMHRVASEEGSIRARGELLLVDEDRLSGEQRRVAAGLRRLYHSLCGAIPGQYWPQGLLDSAGKFNRPPFPAHHSQPQRDFDS